MCPNVPKFDYSINVGESKQLLADYHNTTNRLQVLTIKRAEIISSIYDKSKSLRKTSEIYEQLSHHTLHFSRVLTITKWFKKLQKKGGELL